MSKINLRKISPCIWFNDQAEAAAKLYTSLFENSRILDTTYYVQSLEEVSGKKAGSVMTVVFELDGQSFIALNGGPHFQLTPAISFSVDCETQEEIDHLWGKLTEGGSAQPCGWLVDRFGVSWQIVPKMMSEMVQSEEPVRFERVMRAMLTMEKLDLAAIRKAYEG